MVKREFQHPYTTETKAAVIDEANELVRVSFLLIEHSAPSLAPTGTIGFEVEEEARVCIVRIRGDPTLVRRSAAIFSSIDGWTEQRRRVTMRATTNIRTIPSGIGVVARNHPGPLAAPRTTVRASVPRLSAVAHRLGRPVAEVKPALQQYNAYYKDLQMRGFMPRNARVLADNAFRHELGGVFVPPRK